MSLKIDFEELPYDLFQLLELSEDCTTKDVKKAYKKAVIKYHPDKNPNVDDEFFSWVSLAHKILSNSEHREMYLEWKNWTDDHSRLKDMGKREKLSVPTNKSYKEINEDLNKKHGYIEDNTSLNYNEMNKLMSNLKFERDSVKNQKERISDINSAFDSLKQDKNRLNERGQEIIEYNGELTSINGSNKYGSLSDIGKLYGVNENLATKNITSFNNAFKLSAYQEYIPDNLSLEQKIKNYNNETDYLNKLNKKNKKD